MAQIFKDAGDVIRSNILDMIDKAKDPKKMANLIVADLSTEISKATASYGTMKGSVNSLKGQIDKNQKAVDEANANAKSALGMGREDLARTALENASASKQLVESMMPQWESLNNQANKMLDDIKKMEAQLVIARARAAAVGARTDAAKAAQRTGAAFSSSNAKGFESAMSKMEDRVLQEEGKASAYSDLSSTSDNDFQKEMASASVDADLARMKAEMGIE